MRILLFLLLLSTSTVSAQQIITYYKGRGVGKTDNKREAYYIQKLTVSSDSIKNIELIEIKTNKVISKVLYKGMEPVGKWLVTNAIGKAVELDYDFKLNYGDSLCKKDTAAFIKFKMPQNHPLADNDSLGYIAPKLINGRSVALFVQQNIAYPAQAIEREMSGTVWVQFIIGTDGKFEGMAINKSAGVMLDKEAMRIIREMRFTGSPSLKGIAKKICLVVPIKFMLEE